MDKYKTQETRVSIVMASENPTGGGGGRINTRRVSVNEIESCTANILNFVFVCKCLSPRSSGDGESPVGLHILVYVLGTFDYRMKRGMRSAMLVGYGSAASGPITLHAALYWGMERRIAYRKLNGKKSKSGT
jgi:hypothetical protein